MKRLFLSLFFIIFALSTFAQNRVYILSDSRQYCYLSKTTFEFFNCEALTKTESTFIMDDVLNKENGYEGFYHMTPNINSFYEIEDSEEDEGIVLLDVVSDGGNYYRYVFDFNNQRIVTLFMNASQSFPDRWYVVIFSVTGVLIL